MSLTEPCILWVGALGLETHRPSIGAAGACVPIVRPARVPRVPEGGQCGCRTVCSTHRSWCQACRINSGARDPSSCEGSTRRRAISARTCDTKSGIAPPLNECSGLCTRVGECGAHFRKVGGRRWRRHGWRGFCRFVHGGATGGRADTLRDTTEIGACADLRGCRQDLRLLPERKDGSRLARRRCSHCRHLHLQRPLRSPSSCRALARADR